MHGRSGKGPCPGLKGGAHRGACLSASQSGNSTLPPVSTHTALGRVVVAGGRGFVGASVATSIRHAGGRVVLLSRQSGAWKEQGGGPLDAPALLGPQFHDASGAVSAVVNAAGTTEVGPQLWEANVEFAERLAEQAGALGVPFVHISSAGVYGDAKEGVFGEGAPLRPVGAYEISKAVAEKRIAAVAESHKVPCVILRPTIVFGEGMRNRSLVALVGIARRGLLFRLGPRGAIMNYVAVANVAEAVVAGLKHWHKGVGYFNVSQDISFEVFARVIAGAVGRTAHQRGIPLMTARCLASLSVVVPGLPLTRSRVDALTRRASFPAARLAKELRFREVVGLEDALLEYVGKVQGHS